MLENSLSQFPLDFPTLGVDLDAAGEKIRPRILIIDDDPDHIAMVKLILRQADYDVCGAPDHRAAVEKCIEIKPDLILLDVMMPGQDGFQIFQRLRQVTRAPIIFISAAPRTESLSHALEMGGEDFISKPFHHSEITARVKKVLHQSRSGGPQGSYFFPEIDLAIDLEDHSVVLQGNPIRLLQREFSLLSILAEHAPRNVSYEKITHHLWGEDTRRTRAILKTIAFNLRRKLEADPVRPHILANNRSIGYQLITTP